MKLLLLGSSIIKRWKNCYINNHEIINRGINGLVTKTLISNDYLTNIFKVEKPTHIILYCGGNDLRKNFNSIITFENIKQFIQELQNVYKNAYIIIISIIKSPIMYHENRIEYIKHLNRELKKITKYQNNIFYIDVNRELNNSIYFQKDNLHLNNMGYDILNRKINILFDKI